MYFSKPVVTTDLISSIKNLIDFEMRELDVQLW